jgi:hypothetical protein
LPELIDREVPAPIASSKHRCARARACLLRATRFGLAASHAHVQAGSACDRKTHEHRHAKLGARTHRGMHVHSIQKEARSECKGPPPTYAHEWDDFHHPVAHVARQSLPRARLALQRARTTR